MMRHIFFTGMFCCMMTLGDLAAQTVIRGKVVDESTGEAMINANVMVTNSLIGCVTDYDGEFILKTELLLPITLQVSYVGYETQFIEVTNATEFIRVRIKQDVLLDEIVFEADRYSIADNESPIARSSMNIPSIKQIAGIGFYREAGNLPEVDGTYASFGSIVLNTRGFNSTSPVRTLQLIDGVDNQAPGLNFSLGNFLGVSELDILKMEIIAGAASAYYGPAAFNGVINMETKNPFYNKGLSGLIRFGERNLGEGALRYADVLKRKDGLDVFAYKLNLYALHVSDWKAENYEPITDSEVPASNPGRYDAVNIYGDAYYARNDYQDTSCVDEYSYPGVGIFYRRGYKEVDLVEYETKNYKANLSLQLRTLPTLEGESPVLIFSSSYGAGTTVYQGENRFSLKDIHFIQNKIEFSKREKYFIRAYHTYENAGKSYDPYFTALRLQELSKSDANWNKAYNRFWYDDGRIPDRMHKDGYPEVKGTWPALTFDCDSAHRWLATYHDSLAYWHLLAANFADTASNPGELMNFLVPGTASFDSAFQSITSKYNNEEGGTKFYDRSSLFHIGGEYVFTPVFLSELRVGGNYRLYSPKSNGTIFSDTSGTHIHIDEIGAYTGMKKKFFDQKLIGTATIRFDKSKNLDWVVSPAASLIYHPLKGDTYFRFSFSSAVRNPTLIDQYQYLNVGPAILAGHFEKVDSLITTNSFMEYLKTGDHHKLDYFNIDAIRSEKVKTVEFGIRTTPMKRVYADVTYYHNTYTDFLGYLIGISAIIDTLAPVANFKDLQVYRYSANTRNKVTTQGVSIALNYRFLVPITLSGNYSYNALRKTVADDPIIPAYNTPRHKFNIGISGFDLPLTKSPLLRRVGFNVHYKWVEGFRFEGSPQFTGNVPSYGVVDAQVNVLIEKINTTIKLGASNVLNNKHIETYGGPKVGRHAYISAAYNF